ncbi:hypothetical protein LAZ67_12001149 [Cordylochernes scorpioides]|uniref:Uncharacterized protein n=1 Tax=Cordylochernes scorpioides TaxID=51811 RepID=A0ABY6L2Y7_9ARAC|nr:hypothetical protein LAZ67_12001149 [Cordylochernes scorpioides]
MLWYNSVLLSEDGNNAKVTSVGFNPRSCLVDLETMIAVTVNRWHLRCHLAGVGGRLCKVELLFTLEIRKKKHKVRTTMLLPKQLLPSDDVTETTMSTVIGGEAYIEVLEARRLYGEYSWITRKWEVPPYRYSLNRTPAEIRESTYNKLKLHQVIKDRFPGKKTPLYKGQFSFEKLPYLQFSNSSVKEHLFLKDTLALQSGVVLYWENPLTNTALKFNQILCSHYHVAVVTDIVLQLAASSKENIDEEVKKILREMSHNFQMTSVRFTGYLLAKVMKRIYNGIYVNIQGIEKVMEDGTRRFIIAGDVQKLASWGKPRKEQV